MKKSVRVMKIAFLAIALAIIASTAAFTILAMIFAITSNVSLLKTFVGWFEIVFYTISVIGCAIICKDVVAKLVKLVAAR